MRPRQSHPATPLSRHAESRMGNRGIPSEAVEMVLNYGRIVYTRGAVIYAIGRNEVADALAKNHIHLEEFEGVQVVCATDDDRILTVYRNHDFRKLRPKQGRRFTPQTGCRLRRT